MLQYVCTTTIRTHVHGHYKKSRARTSSFTHRHSHRRVVNMATPPDNGFNRALGRGLDRLIYLLLIVICGFTLCVLLHTGRGGTCSGQVPRTANPLLGAGPLWEERGRSEFLYRAHHRLKHCIVTVGKHCILPSSLSSVVYCVCQERVSQWTVRCIWV